MARRRSGLVLLTVLSVGLITLRCSPPSQHSRVRASGPTSYLVVMSAYPPELTKLLEEADVEDTRLIEGRAYHIGTVGSIEVILTLSGIGLDSAAVTAQALLDRFDVSCIVFSGIAGGINPSLNIGDVTVAAHWGQADGQRQPDDDDFWIPADPTMLEIAARAARGVDLSRCTPDSTCLEHEPKVVVGGNGVSNSFFVDDRLYREWLWTTFQANAVDMETAAVAGVAYAHGVPYIAFRSLSDLAGGGPGANEIDTFFQLAADNAASVVIAFLEAWAEHTLD